MKRSVDVLIVVEHVARELETACLIQHFLKVQHGLSSEISFLAYTTHAMLSQIRPTVAVVPHCRSQHSPIRYWWDNVPIVNMAWEQILSNANRHANAPWDDYVRKQVHYLPWGPAYQDYLLSHNIPGRNIYVVGSPNFALLEERYRFLCRSRRELSETFGLNPHDRWVFFPENFGWAFLSDAQLESRIKPEQYTRENAVAYRDFQRRTLATVTDWLARIGDFKDLTVVLRPRPSTPLADFVSRVGGKLPPNVAIIKDGTAREWLLASDLVMSNYSTLLADAAVAQKPTFCVKPEPIPLFMQADFLNQAPIVASLEQFISVLSSRNWDPDGASELRRYALGDFHCDADPFERIAAILARLCQSAKGKARFLYGRGWYHWDQSWRQKIPFGLRCTISRMFQGTPTPADWDGKSISSISTYSSDQPCPDRVKRLSDAINRNIDQLQPNATFRNLASSGYLACS